MTAQDRNIVPWSIQLLTRWQQKQLHWSRCTPSKDRYKISLLAGFCSSVRPPTARFPMGRQGLSGCYASFWLAISPKSIQCFGRCTSMVFLLQRCHPCGSLPGRFRDNGTQCLLNLGQKPLSHSGSVGHSGVPLAKDKCGGPSPILTFLGIEIETHQRVLRPQEKLLRVQTILTQWRKKQFELRIISWPALLCS